MATPTDRTHGSDPLIGPMDRTHGPWGMSTCHAGVGPMASEACRGGVAAILCMFPWIFNCWDDTVSAYHVAATGIEHSHIEKVVVPIRDRINSKGCFPGTVGTGTELSSPGRTSQHHGIE